MNEENDRKDNGDCDLWSCTSALFIIFLLSCANRFFFRLNKLFVLSKKPFIFSRWFSLWYQLKNFFYDSSFKH